MECVEAYHDDFAVDDLLDLSLADDFERDKAHRDEDEQEHDKDFNFSDQSVSLEDLFTFPGSELELPLCDMAELEWLSNFVEDSFSDSYLSGEFQVKPTSGNDTTTAVAVESRFSRNPVPVKPRTKRKRTSRRVWTLPSPSSAVAGPGISNQSAASNKGKKKVRRKAGEVSASSSTGGGGGQQTQPRRCSHCGVQKTPQWRMGPLGAKTLCNACGVRFKSGRLLPEYRPACSPTFSALLHSNSHRKVLELRQTKANSTGPVGSSPV